VVSLAFHPNGAELLSGATDGSIRVWDLFTNEPYSVLSIDAQPIHALAFDPTGKLLATGTGDYTVDLWNLSDLEPWSVLTGFKNWVDGLQFNPDSSRVLAIPDRSPAQTWNLNDWASSPINEVDHVVARSVAASRDGKLIAFFTHDGRLRIWDVEAGRLAMDVVDSPPEQCAADAPAAIAFDPNASTIATARNSPVVTIRDRRSGAAKRELRGHLGLITALSYSPDGSVLASGAADCTIRLWNPESGEQIHELRGHIDPVRCLGFSPFEPRLASCGDEDGTLRLWDSTSGEFLLALRGSGSKVNVVSFSPDGKRLAGGLEDGTVRIWETDTVSSRCSARRDAVSLREKCDPIVLEWFERDRTLSSAIADLRADARLNPIERDMALRLARSRTDAPDVLENRAWIMVLRPGRAQEYYREAVALAESAQAATGDRKDAWLMWRTLGCAQYRAGEIERARDSLNRADELQPNRPATLAFLAMAEQRLGNRVPAKKLLGRLEEIMPNSPDSARIGVEAVWHEAKSLIDSETRSP
jgi:WD40 repeat protein